MKKSLALLGLVAILFSAAALEAAEDASSSSSSSSIPTPDDFAVHGLDKIEPAYATFDGKMYAGLIPTTLYAEKNKRKKKKKSQQQEEEGKLTFRLFVPNQLKYDDSLVIWLNGGPGCSSFGGGIAENQPVTIGSAPAGFYGFGHDSPLRENPYAWTKTSHMLYVEHPQGTGFSKGPIPTDETQASRDFYYFLQNLLDVFGSDMLLRDKRLYIFGESYAGMYVPSIAEYILNENLNKKKKHKSIRLTGIGLGNGWIDPRVQGPAVIDYAWWHGMIDSNTRESLHNEWERCKDGSKHQPEPFHTFTTPDECGIMPAVLLAAGKDQLDWGSPNAYDVTTWDKYDYLMDPNSTMWKFYNNPEVQDALNIPRQYWYECLPGAGRRRRRRLEEDDEENDLLPGEAMLRHDKPVSVVPYIAHLLDHDIQVLVYAGDRDMTTNAQGSELLLDQMTEWSGAAGWKDPDQYQRGLWLPPLPHRVGGYSKEYQNLKFLIVSNSGHLVPFNEPELALDLITRAVEGRSFIDQDLPKITIAPPPVPDKRSSRKNQGGGGSFFGSVFFLLIGVVIGMLISKYFPHVVQSRQEGYQMVPNAAAVEASAVAAEQQLTV